MFELDAVPGFAVVVFDGGYGVEEGCGVAATVGCGVEDAREFEVEEVGVGKNSYILLEVGIVLGWCF